MAVKGRVIVDSPRDCYTNMALDEALFQLWRPGDPPVVRIYMWRPTSLTIGRGQGLGEVNYKAAMRLGVCLTRRPSGGGAIVHPEGYEVTYSIILPAGFQGLPASVDDSARMIARALLVALKKLGVEAYMVDTPYDPTRSPLCYLRGGRASIAVKGFKVSGSAQVRWGRKLLQHGTILLRVDAELWARLLGLEANDVWENVRGLYDLGYGISVSELVNALIEGFEETLGLRLEEGVYTDDEKLLAQSLVYKYSSPSWLSGLKPNIPPQEQLQEYQA